MAGPEITTSSREMCNLHCLNKASGLICPLVLPRLLGDIFSTLIESTSKFAWLLSHTLRSTSCFLWVMCSLFEILHRLDALHTFVWHFASLLMSVIRPQT